MNTLKVPTAGSMALSVLFMISGCGDDVRCGSGTVRVGGECVVDRGDELIPRVTSVGYDELKVTSHGPHHVLHPISVHVTVDVEAEPFEGEIVVGLEADDGSTGCLLGPIDIVHAPAGMDDLSGTHELAAEFVIETGCAALIDRPSHVTVAFDPWRNLEWVGRAPLDPDMSTAATLFEQVNLSQIDETTCTNECVAGVELLTNPGPDLELLHFELDSSVIVVPIASHDAPAATAAELQQEAEDTGLVSDAMGRASTFAAQEDHTADLPETPHISVGLDYRLLGLDRDTTVGPDEVHFAYRIRPIEGAVGTEYIDEVEMDWLPVHREEHVEMTNGTHRVDHQELDFHDDLAPLDVHTTHAPLTFVGETLARITDGTWSHTNEFELEVCANTTMDEAIFPDEPAARANHCADLHVVLIRQHHGPQGQIHQTNHGTSADSFDRSHIYSERWGASQAALEVKAWLENGYTDFPNGIEFGELGDQLDGPGSYYEAGAEAVLEVFGARATIARAYAQFRDHTVASGEVDWVSMEGRILVWHFLPSFTSPLPDGTLTLQDILDIQRARTGNEYPTEKTFTKTLVGANADVPGGGDDGHRRGSNLHHQGCGQRDPAGHLHLGGAALDRRSILLRRAANPVEDGCSSERGVCCHLPRHGRDPSHDSRSERCRHHCRAHKLRGDGQSLGGMVVPHEQHRRRGLLAMVLREFI